MSPPKKLVVPTILQEIAGESNTNAVPRLSPKEKASKQVDTGALFPQPSVNAKFCESQYYVKNIWYPLLPSTLPCNFIEFDAKINSVQISISFIEDGVRYEIFESVHKNIFICNNIREFEYETTINEELFATEKSVNSEKFEGFSNYLNNSVYLKISRQILEKFGEKYEEQYYSEYKNQVTLCSNKQFTSRDVDVCQEYFEYGFADTTPFGTQYDCKKTLQSIKGKFIFQQYYIKSKTEIQKLLGHIEEIIIRYMRGGDYGESIEDIYGDIKDELARVKHVESELLNLLGAEKADSKAENDTEAKTFAETKYIEKQLIQINVQELEIIQEQLGNEVAQARTNGKISVALVQNSMIAYAILLIAIFIFIEELLEEFSYYQTFKTNEEALWHPEHKSLLQVFFLLLCNYESGCYDLLEHCGEEINELIHDTKKQEQLFGEALDDEIINAQFSKEPTEAVLEIVEQQILELSVTDSENVVADNNLDEIFSLIEGELKILQFFYYLPLNISVGNESTCGVLDFLEVQKEDQDSGTLALLAYFDDPQVRSQNKSAISVPCVMVDENAILLSEGVNDYIEELKVRVQLCLSILEDFYALVVSSDVINTSNEGRFERFQELVLQEDSCDFAVSGVYDELNVLDLVQSEYLKLRGLAAEARALSDNLYVDMLNCDFSTLKMRVLEQIDQELQRLRQFTQQTVDETYKCLSSGVISAMEQISQEIAPRSLNAVMAITERVLNTDFLFVFEALFEQSYDLPMSFIEEVEMGVVWPETVFLQNYIRAIKRAQLNLVEMRDQEALYAQLVQQLTQWQEQQFESLIEYIFELLSLTPEDYVEAKQYPLKFKQNHEYLCQDFQIIALDSAKDAKLLALLEEYRKQEKEFYIDICQGLTLPVHTRRYSSDLLVKEVQKVKNTHVPTLELYYRASNNSKSEILIWKMYNEVEYLFRQMEILADNTGRWCSLLHIETLDNKNDAAVKELFNELYMIFVYSDVINNIINSPNEQLHSIHGEQLVKMADQALNSIYNVKILKNASYEVSGYNIELEQIETCIDTISETLVEQVHLIYMISYCELPNISQDTSMQIANSFKLDLYDAQISLKELEACLQEYPIILDYLYEIKKFEEAEESVNNAMDRIIASISGITVEKKITINMINMLEFSNQFSRANLLTYLQEIHYYQFNSDFEADSGISPASNLEIEYPEIIRRQHSEEVEERLRDLEKIVNLLLFFYNRHLIIINLLTKLELLDRNGNLIQIFEYEKYEQFNILSPIERNTFHTELSTWNEICDEIESNRNLITLCSKQEIFIEVEEVFILCYNVYSRVVKNRNEYYYKYFSYQEGNEFNDKEDGQIDNFIIPMIEEQYYPSSYFAPHIIDIFFNSFETNSQFIFWQYGNRNSVYQGLHDIIIANSQIKHRVILGLKSHGEDFILSNSVKIPEYNYELPDILKQEVKETIICALREHYEYFKEEVIEKKENASSPIVFLQNFFLTSNVVVSIILIMTIAYQYLSEDLSEEPLYKVADHEYFGSIESILNIIIGVLQSMEEYNPNKRYTMLLEFCEHYINFVRDLELEIRSTIGLLQDESYTSKSLQNISTIECLLCNSKELLPFLIYEEDSQELRVVSLSQGYSLGTGSHWQGVENYNMFEQHQFKYLRIVNEIIEQMIQHHTVMLLDSEYEFYESPMLNQIMSILSYYTMREVEYCIISTKTFQEQVQEISAGILNNNIVLIIGAEWLPQEQQEILGELSERITNKEGVLHSILLPTVNKSSTDEGEASLSFEQVKIASIKELGFLIFYLPHLICCKKASEYVFVPSMVEYNKLHENYDSYEVDHSARKQPEESNANRGCNCIYLEPIPCEIASKFIDNFNFCSPLRLLDKPVQPFEAYAGQYAGQFLTVSSLLREMGSMAPKLVIYEIPLIFHLAQKNLSSNASLCQVLLFYLMKKLPAIFYTEEEYAYYPELLSMYISLAFDLCHNERKELFITANTYYHYCLNALSMNEYKTLKVKQKHADFNRLFRTQLTKDFDKNNVEPYFQSAQLSLLSNNEVFDFIFLDKLICSKKPFMITSISHFYALSFVELLVQFNRYLFYYVNSSKEIFAALDELQYKNENSIIAANISSLEQFMDYEQFVVAFWMKDSIIKDQNEECYEFEERHESKKPELIFLIDPETLKECLKTTNIILFTSIYCLVPDMKQDYLSNTISKSLVKESSLELEKYFTSIRSQEHGNRAYSDILVQYYEMPLKEEITLKQYKLQQWIITNIDAMFEFFIKFALLCATLVFPTSNEINTSEIISSILEEFLCREGVIEVWNQEVEPRNDTGNCFRVENIEKEQLENESLINYNDSGTDYSGMYKNYAMQKHYQPVVEYLTNEDILDYTLNNNFSFAQDHLHNTKYQLNLEFFTLLCGEVEQQCQELLLLCQIVYSAVFSSFLINSLVNCGAEACDLANIYREYIDYLMNNNVEQVPILSIKKQFFALFSYIYTAEESEQEDEIILQPFDEVISSAVVSDEFLLLFADEIVLPEEYPEDYTGYLWYDQTIQFVKLEAGEGFLKSVSEKTQAEIIRESVRINENSMSEEMIPVSLQEFSDNYLNIALDGKRVLIIIFLSCVMMTDLTIVMSGHEESGKSTLIKIAQLLNEQQVHLVRATINDEHDTVEISKILNNLLEYYDLEQAVCGENQELELLEQNNYKLVVQLTIPEYQEQRESLVLQTFIRDHIYNCISNYGNKQLINAIVKYQNLCIIIETDQTFNDTSDENSVVRVPIIEKEMLQKLLFDTYQNTDVRQTNDYCSGLYSIKQAFPDLITHSLILFKELAFMRQELPVDPLNEYDKQYLLPGIISLIYSLSELKAGADININLIMQELLSLQVLNELQDQQSSGMWNNILLYTNGNICIQPSVLLKLQGFYLGDSSKDQEVPPVPPIDQMLDSLFTDMESPLKYELLQLATSSQYYSYVCGHYQPQFDPSVYLQYISQRVLQEYQRQRAQQIFYSRIENLNGTSNYFAPIYGVSIVSQCDEEIREYCAKREKQFREQENITHYQRCDLLTAEEENISFAGKVMAQLSCSELQNNTMKATVYEGFTLWRPKQLVIDLIQEYTKSEVVNLFYTEFSELHANKVFVDSSSMFQAVKMQSIFNQSKEQEAVQNSNILFSQVAQLFRKGFYKKNSDFGYLLIIFRILVALALGVRPSVVIPQEAVPGSEEFASQLETLLPIELKEQRMNMACRESDVFYSDELISDVAGESSVASKESKQEGEFDYSQYVQEPICLEIIAESSKLQYKSEDQLPIIYYINNTLFEEIGEALFSVEELCNLAILYSANTRLNRVLSVEELKLVIETRWQLSVVNDVFTPSEYLNGSQYNHIDLQQYILSPTLPLNNIVIEIEARRFEAKNQYSTELLENMKTNALSASIQQSYISAQLASELEGNLSRLTCEEFYQLYEKSQCATINHYTLPENIEFSNESYSYIFSSSVVIVYKEMLKYAGKNYVTLQEFSKVCKYYYDLLLEKAQEFLLALNYLFSFNELLSSFPFIEEEEVHLMPFEALDIHELISSLEHHEKRTESTAGEEQEYEICEYYNLVFSLLELIKPEYKRLTRKISEFVFDAVAMGAYQCFYSSGIITECECDRYIEEYKIEHSINGAIKDKFALMLYYIFSSSGYELSFECRNKEENAFLSFAEEDTSEVVNNYYAMESVNCYYQACINICAVMNVNNDELVNLLYLSDHELRQGIVQFIASYQMVQALSNLILLYKLKEEETIKDFNYYIQYAAVNEERDNGKKLYKLLEEYSCNLVFIDLEEQANIVSELLSSALEQELVVIILCHADSSIVSGETESVITSLLFAREQEETAKGEQIHVGSALSTISQPLQDYPLIFSLDNNDKLFSAMNRFGLDNEYNINNQSILLISADDVSANVSLNDNVTQAVFSDSFSSAEEKDMMLETASQTELYFKKLIHKLESLNILEIQPLFENLQLDISNIDQVMLTLVEQVGKEAIDGEQVLKELASLENSMYETRISEILECQKVIIEIEHLCENKTAVLMTESNKGIEEFSTYLKYLRSTEQELGQEMTDTIEFTSTLIEKLALVHTPLCTIFTNEFYEDFEKVLATRIPNIIQEGEEELEYQASSNSNHSGILEFLKNNGQGVLVAYVVKELLNMLLKQVFSCLPAQYIQPIYFIIILSVMQLGNEKVEENEDRVLNDNILKILLFFLDTNENTHVSMLTYSLICRHSINNKVETTVNSYDSMIPSEFRFSLRTKLFWSWIQTLSCYSSKIEETVEWFLKHYSSIAAFSQSKDVFEDVIKHSIQSITFTNKEDIKLYQFLKSNNILDEISKLFEIQDNPANNISLPHELERPTFDNVFITGMLFMSVFEQKIPSYFNYINAFILEGEEINNDYKKEYALSQHNINTIRSHLVVTNENTKIFAAVERSVEILMSCFCVEYNMDEDVSCLVCEALHKIMTIGYTIMKEYEIQHRIEQLSKKNPNQVVQKEELVLLFHDNAINPALFIEYANMIGFGDLNVISEHSISFEQPDEYSIDSNIHILNIKQTDEQLSSLKCLLEVIKKRQSGQERYELSLPIFVLICSNTFAEEFDEVSEYELSIEQNITLSSCVKELINNTNASICFLSSCINLSGWIAHVFTQFFCQAHLLLNNDSSVGKVECSRTLISETIEKPSIKVLELLLIKYAILLSKPNYKCTDMISIETISFIINQLLKFNGGPSTELPASLIDLQLLHYSSKYDNDNFDCNLSNLLHRIYSGISDSLFPYLSDEKYYTEFADTENDELENDDKSNDSTYESGRLLEESSQESPEPISNSTSFSLSEQDIGKKAPHEKEIELTFDEELNELLNNYYGTKIEYSVKEIQNEIVYTLFPKRRMLRHESIKVPNLEELTKNNSVMDVLELYERFEDISSSVDDIIVNNREDPFCEEFSSSELYRIVLSSPPLKSILNENENKQELIKDKFDDYKKMPILLRLFLENIKLINSLEFNILSHYSDPKAIVSQILPDYLAKNLESQGIYDKTSFLSRDNYWQLSALTYSPLLGDIFNFLFTEQEQELETEEFKLKLIITLERPKSEPLVMPDGNIQYSASRMQPFYIEIDNMELFGACYDFENHTICDATPSSNMGYRQHMKLYASVAIIQQDSRYNNYLAENSADCSDCAVRVPSGFVPVELRIGGYIRPYVLLKNKTPIADRDWLKKGVFIGVRYI